MLPILSLCRTLVCSVAILCGFTLLCGCEMLPHELQPSQLRKLNRGPALGRDTSNFSIPDPEVPAPFADLDRGIDPFHPGPTEE